MTSVAQVAQRAGVSPITVSRVVRNHPSVSVTTRERVQRAIDELNYIPNAAARSLKQARSGLIGLLITDLSSPFFTAVARGVDDAVRATGFTVVLGNSNDDPKVETEFLRAMGEHRVDGMILVPTDRANDVLTQLLPKPIPLVLLDRTVPGVVADVVRCNTRSGTFALCQHLIRLGHRRIAIVGGIETAPTWCERVAGYRQALGAAAVPTSDDFVITGNYRFDGGAAAVRTIIAQSGLPNAIIAANAQVALGVLDELVARGYKVPEDIAVSAIDDPLPSSTFWPRLTVVEQPGYEMGKAAIELLISRLHPTLPEAPMCEVVFEARLKIGVSCGEIP